MVYIQGAVVKEVSAPEELFDLFTQGNITIDII
jgi:hypothetical protein